MGFLDRVKAVRGACRQVDVDIERWARIVAIDPGPGPVTVLHLEIHSNGAPAHVELANSRIPAASRLRWVRRWRTGVTPARTDTTWIPTR
jgi:hypothetical protein